MTPLDALRASAGRLRGIVEPLEDAALAGPAYPAEWTIAQVLSHLGSGAVILRRRIDDGVSGTSTPDDFAPTVWDEWNAMTSRQQADGVLTADDDVLARLDALTPAEAAAVSVSMGPLTLDLDGLLGLRVNEHALHTWDVEVALDPGAVVPTALAERLVDNLALIAGFTAKPTAGGPATVTIRTTDPERGFVVSFSETGAGFEATPPGSHADLELPAEALGRLVYGRLDASHTPAVDGDAAVLERLRATFPGP